MKKAGIKITSLLSLINLLIFLSGFCLMFFSPAPAAAAQIDPGLIEPYLDGCGDMPVQPAVQTSVLRTAPAGLPACCLTQNNSAGPVIASPEPVPSGIHYPYAATQAIDDGSADGSKLYFSRRIFPPPEINFLSSISLRI